MDHRGFAVMLRRGSKTGRIYAEIRQRITAGRYPSDAKLPSLLQLAEEFAVAPMTVRTALKHLEQDGLITCVQGAGTYVLPRHKDADLHGNLAEIAQRATDALKAEHALRTQLA